MVKASIGLLERRSVGEYNVRVYADRLAVWRKDGQQLTREQLQAVKIAVWGDRVAVEVYPAQRDVVNLRHMRHLWTGPHIEEAVARLRKSVSMSSRPNNYTGLTCSHKTGNFKTNRRAPST